MDGCVFIFFWILCGIGAAGFQNAYFRAEYSFIRATDREGRKNLAASLAMVLFGPAALVFTFFTTGFWGDGWSLRWKADL